MPENSPSSLAGKRIVITRALEQSEALLQELAARGAIARLLPLLSFGEPEDSVPLNEAIAGIAQFEWLILTSAQAVRALTERCADLHVPQTPTNSHLRVACVGPVTAEAARSANLPVEYVAMTHNGVALANELGCKLQGAKVLLPRSDRANPDLPEALRRYGAEVTEVVAYRTLRPASVGKEELKKVIDGHVDAILFFSPSGLQHFSEIVGKPELKVLQDKLAIAAVGPVTAKALREAGVERIVVASDTTAASVIDALEKHFVAAKATPQGARQA